MSIFGLFQSKISGVVDKSIKAGFFTSAERQLLMAVIRAEQRTTLRTAEKDGVIGKLIREPTTNAISPDIQSTWFDVSVSGPSQEDGMKGIWVKVSNDIWSHFMSLKEYIDLTNIYDLGRHAGSTSPHNRDFGGSREDMTVMPVVEIEATFNGVKETSRIEWGVPVSYTKTSSKGGSKKGGKWIRHMFIPFRLLNEQRITTRKEVETFIKTWMESHLSPNGKKITIFGKPLSPKPLGKQLGEVIVLEDIPGAHLVIQWLKSRGTKAQGYIVMDGLLFPAPLLYFHDPATQKRYHGIVTLPSGYMTGDDLDLFKTVRDEVMESPRFVCILQKFRDMIGIQLQKPTRTPIDKHLQMRAGATDVLKLAEDWGLSFGQLGSGRDSLVCIFNEDAENILGKLDPSDLMRNPIKDPRNAETWRDLLVLRELGVDGEDGGHAYGGTKSLHLGKIWMRQAGYSKHDYLCHKHYKKYLWVKGVSKPAPEYPGTTDGPKGGPFSEIVSLSHPFPDGKRYELTLYKDPQTGSIKSTALEMANVAIRYGTFDGVNPGGSAVREMKVDAMADAFCDLAARLGRDVTKEDREDVKKAFRFFDTTGKKKKSKKAKSHLPEIEHLADEGQQARIQKKVDEDSEAGSIQRV